MGIKRYRANPRHVVETEFDDAEYVSVKDFDRITAERDALQLRLNAVEEENDRLKNNEHLELVGYEGSSGLYYSRLAAVANGEQSIEPVYRVKK